MNLPEIVKGVKEKIQTAPDRIALTILIWLEKEPSQDRVVLSPPTGDSRGPHLDYNKGKDGGRHSNGQETAA